MEFPKVYGPDVKMAGAADSPVRLLSLGAMACGVKVGMGAAVRKLHTPSFIHYVTNFVLSLENSRFTAIIHL